ncbi:MAG: HdeD family acid-resistance protein, partial [Geminicoccaceae bacterium]
AVAEFYLAFQVHGGWRIAGAVLTGLISLIAGVWLLVNPAAGAAALTLLLAAYFVATGVVKGIAAFQLRGVGGSGWTFFSAVCSVILGLLVFSGWPGTAIWLLGLIVGIDLLFYGWALLALRSAVSR